ncbi:thiol reductant ABC exporter subunit CydC [Actinomyces sp. B33]|uniref:thiol reductant ABC exporter subunit CydC n=1 Tax=Actinomyces sp. B33 TaxID=2942131 RepID=UPI0023405C0B|nr:thiol reductant ABC exporter subunit CydC [Actinomyces sp. B33]MDC4232754.1 thiol reductant ABC exporter subunit CydC [Actinomyces sp. B33]
MTPATRPALARRLLAVARPVLAPLGLSVLARTAFLLLGVGLFAFAGWAVVAIPTGACGAWTTTGVVWALIAMSLLKGLARYLEQFAGHFVAFHSLALLRGYFYDRLEPQAPAATEGADSGDLLNRVTKDIDRIEVFFAHTLAPGLTAVIVPVAALTWMGAALSWWLVAALAAPLLAAGLLVPMIAGRATAAAAVDIRRTRGVLAAHVTDSVQGVREVLAFGAQRRRLAQMRALEDRIAAAQRAAGARVALRRTVNQALLGGSVIAVAATALGLVGAGEIAAPEAGLAVGAALGLFPSVLAVEDFTADLDQAFASAARVFAVTDRPPAVTDPAEPADSDGAGDIDVVGVSFAYPAPPDDTAARPDVLHDLTLRIPAGRTTAVVGASGSGKSTLGALLTRVWDPDRGSIRIGGVDLRDLPLERLRDLVASAPQRPYIFNASVRDNLLLAVPGASDADLARACADAGLDEWIASEPDGMGTGVGEMGERLSGGQRQRLALARALLRDAPIVVLDEATSQVDAATEKTVLDGIRRATRGRTLVVIAHRISTVADADLVVVMDAGRIVEQGAYEELMASGGALAALAARETGL